MGQTLQQIIRQSKDNEYVTFTTISSNLILKGKSQDITEALTT